MHLTIEDIRYLQSLVSLDIKENYSEKYPEDFPETEVKYDFREILKDKIDFQHEFSSHEASTLQQTRWEKIKIMKECLDSDSNLSSFFPYSIQKNLLEYLIRCAELIESHDSQGRNYTNAQYIKLLQENESLKKDLDQQMKTLTIDHLRNCFQSAEKEDVAFVAVKIRMPGFHTDEIIINPLSNVKEKLAYYEATYTEDLRHKHAPGISIVGFTFGDSMESIQEDFGY